jgi:hypothetical protein
MPCRQHLHRERRAFFETHRVGNWNHLRCGRECILRVGPAAQRGDSLARFQIGHVRANRFDFAGALEAGRIGKLGLHNILPLPEQGIGEVYPGRADLDQHPPGFHLGLRNLGDFQHFGSAGFLEYDCFHLLDLFASRATWLLI